MIRLSRLSDYGIVLMALLAGRTGGEHGAPHNAREVAAEAHLPLPVVSKILKSLARRGLLVSHRGAKGGYSLARPAEQITAAEMIAALEGPIGLTECAAHPGHCVQEASCHVREPWQRINAALRRALADVTLADLVPHRPAQPGTIPLHELAPPPHAATGLGPDDRHR
jgi:FeS assembly SUF system regulator